MGCSWSREPFGSENNLRNKMRAGNSSVSRTSNNPALQYEDQLVNRNKCVWLTVWKETM